MKATTLAGFRDALNANIVQITVTIMKGLPSFNLPGISEMARREARERVRAAIVNNGFEFPLQRIIVDVSPGPGTRSIAALDLAITAGILQATGQLDRDHNTVYIGELALDGTVRPVRATVPMVTEARKINTSRVIVPERNRQEALLAGHPDIRPILHLKDLWALPAPATGRFTNRPDQQMPDLADLRGQEHLRAALEIAAAGRHNLLIVGPPGSGKSLAARRLPSILPPLTEAEEMEVATIASATGYWNDKVQRPFRAPHHTISAAALTGSGRPNWVSEALLAHRGVLYLDEITEFSRSALDMLNDVTRTGLVRVWGNQRKYSYPVEFQMIAAANPCSCGHGPNNNKCRCTPDHIAYYQRVLRQRTSQYPMKVTLELPDTAQLHGPAGETSDTVRHRVAAARHRMATRYTAPRTNQTATPGELFDYAITDDAIRLLRNLTGINNQTHQNTLRIARTIADLADIRNIEPVHIHQALEFVNTTPEVPVS